MRSEEINKPEYVLPSTDGVYVTFSSSISDFLQNRVDLYGSKDGKILALVNNPEGQMEVSVRQAGNRLRRVICSRVLVDCLRSLPRGYRGRILAQRDEVLGALLIGELKPESEFSKEDYVFLDIKNSHRMSYELTSDALRFRTFMPMRSEVLRNGKMLAFVKYSDGSTVLEGGKDMRVLRKPAVVAFAREYWQGKKLYWREVAGAKVLSPDIRKLIELKDLTGFDDLKFEQPLLLELKRSFLIQASPPVTKALGHAVALYSCGPYLALASSADGDVHIEDDDTIRCQSLAQILAVSYIGALRLYLIPHGKLLVLSSEPSPDTTNWPPPDYFCRLMMTREQTPRVMRYGVYRTAATAMVHQKA